jgi:RNA polymerase sigma-B factor
MTRRERPASRRLSEPERNRLHVRYARERRPSDLEALVVSYMPLSRALARRYTTGHGDADLEQVACEGLVKALQRFDPERGTPFTSFAVPTILGELRRHLRDTSWTAHVPRKVQERLRAVRKAAGDFSATHGRAPSAQELSAILECEEESVVDALTAASTLNTVPLDEPTTEGLTTADRLGTVDPGYDRIECLCAIDRALPRLTRDERTVVDLHFGADLTQRQIATEIGVSRSQVGRLLGSALDTLRASAAA